MAEKRYRIQYKFWLDVTQDDQLELAESIKELKQSRSFSKVVREGIRLVVDLWQGRVAVLVEMFPWVEEYFYKRFAEQQPTTDPTILEQLAKLEQLLVEQGNTPITSLRTSTEPKTETSNNQHRQSSDRDDDKAQLVIKKAESNGKSAQNFLDSIFKLQNS